VADLEKLLRACLNWKVIGALLVVGVGVWAVAPKLLIGVLPILLIGVCPLSMMLMMRSTGDHQGASARRTDGADGKGAAREESLADLKSQLEQTRTQEEAIGREIAKLEATFDDERFQSP
jgi:hypothetical protein